MMQIPTAAVVTRKTHADKLAHFCERNETHPGIAPEIPCERCGVVGLAQPNPR
jgi:hypothetical protein